MDFVADLSTDSKYLQDCDIPVAPRRIEPFSIVIFGGGGDLASRKLLPSILSLFAHGELPERFAVLGVGLPALDDEAYRAHMAKACERALGAEFDGEVWRRFAGFLHHEGGAFDDDATYARVQERLREFAVDCGTAVIHHLAVPPDVTPLIVPRLRMHALCGEEFPVKVVVEKPFGRDRASAAALNALLHTAFDEPQIFRIDHYLGKETVQNIAFLRFSNTIFEQLWNNRYVDHVQVTVAEDIGIERRAAFYEGTGVVRDILQNHVMQLVALVAMEPPIGFEAEFMRDEKVKVLRSLRPVAEGGTDRWAVRGQYGPGEVGGEAVPGYRGEEGVAPDSATPTFVAARLAIPNWRWAGVPFYVRAGKRLARRVTEIVVQFRQPPLRLFGRSCDLLEPNLLVLTIQPDEGIRLRFGVKDPGSPNRIAPVNVHFNYREGFSARSQEPYARLLLDCMRGDLTLFARQDGVEAMWDVVDPVIGRWEAARPPDFPNYRAGTWGPAAAGELLARDGRSWYTT